MALFRRKRADGDDASMQALASELGLSWLGAPEPAERRSVTGGLPDLPLLHHGNDGSVRNLAHGELDGVPTQIFNFTVIAYTEDPGRAHRSCVLQTLPLGLPELTISPRERLPRLSEKLSEAGISIGSLDFQERWRLQSASSEFVSQFIDHDLEQWLLGCTVDRARIEVEGGAILVHAPDLPGADEFRPLLDFARGLRERIPSSIHQRYGTSTDG